MSVHRNMQNIFLAASLSIFCTSLAQAQYVGPSPAATGQDIRAILKNPVDDQHVKLQGHILRKIQHEEYIFSDGTGEIVVEIDDRDLPSQPVDDKTKVEIVGEVDTSSRRPPEIEVDTVRLVN